jgi:spoIIIJ-associated protein
VEWVETTGRSLEEAKEAALDRLGVDEAEAEFEVVEEAKAGLFGRVRREARVRARVRPTRPRAKDDRRDRRRRRSKDRTRSDASRGGTSRGGAAASSAQAEAPGRETDRGDGSRGRAASDDNGGGGAAGGTRSRNRRRRRGGRGRGGGSAGGNGASASTRQDGAGGSRGQDGETGKPGGKAMTTEVSQEEQGEIVQDFLDGLVEAFDLDGEVRTETIDDEMLEVQVVGDDLGLLIGPKGATLTAVQELARTVVQRRAEGNPRGRFRIDVGGYRQRRREALERFTRSVAEEVKESGVQKALEPMNASDRKVVHDAVNEIDGVTTTSEGEDPRRRVVILPAD